MFVYVKEITTIKIVLAISEDTLTTSGKRSFKRIAAAENMREAQSRINAAFTLNSSKQTYEANNANTMEAALDQNC